MQLVIFDFDGVVADSEALSGQILADRLSKIGLPTTLEDVSHLYLGRRWSDCIPIMEQRLGKALPDNFLAGQIAIVHARLAAEVKPVPGLLGFLERHAHVPRCIASSSSVDYIRRCLDRMAITHWFEHRFSALDVVRGKPHPELFLKTAAALGVAARDCVVIEDSPMGVMAGKAAEMLTIGLCAGAHVLDGHADRLIQAGADIVVPSYAEATRFLTGQ